MVGDVPFPQDLEDERVLPVVVEHPVGMAVLVALAVWVPWVLQVPEVLKAPKASGASPVKADFQGSTVETAFQDLLVAVVPRAFGVDKVVTVPKVPSELEVLPVILAQLELLVRQAPKVPQVPISP